MYPNVGCSIHCKPYQPLIFEPLPNRFAYIMARGCRNLGRYAFLCGGEPFCHQTGPCQTLRAETCWSQLLVRFGVIFYFNKSRNHVNEVQTNQGRVISGKKRPLPGMHHTEVRSGDGHQISRYPDIQISRYPDVQMSGYPDIRYQILVPDIRYQVSEKMNGNHKELGFPKKPKISSNE